MNSTPPQGALDHLVGQRGGVAHVAAHQVGAGHLHQLAAPQGADGLEVLGQDAGDGGLAGAGVAGKDHVHVDAGGLQALGLAPLLGLHVFGNVPHKGLDFLQADDAVQLGFHGRPRRRGTAGAAGSKGQRARRRLLRPSAAACHCQPHGGAGGAAVPRGPAHTRQWRGRRRRRIPGWASTPLARAVAGSRWSRTAPSAERASPHWARTFWARGVQLPRGDGVSGFRA